MSTLAVYVAVGNQIMCENVYIHIYTLYSYKNTGLKVHKSIVTGKYEKREHIVKAY